MLCSNCHAEISDDSLFCNKCGKEVFKDTKFEKSILINVDDIPDIIKNGSCVENKDIPKKKRLKGTIISLSIIGILIVAVLGYQLINPYLKYQNALKLLNENQYEDAINTFSQIESFKDSKDKITLCKYKQGKLYLQNSEFLESINLFKEIKNYQDSSELLQEAKYQLAKKYISQKKYEMAIQTIVVINTYKDSSALLIQSRYNLAKQYIENKSYDAAISIFEKLKNFEDSQDLKTKCLYLKAVQLYNNGELELSKNIFTDLNYSDSQNYIENINQLEKYQGTWVEDTSTHANKVIINGWNITYISNSQKEVKNFILKENQLKEDKDDYPDTITIINNKLICKTSLGTTHKYSFLNKNVSIPQEIILKEPAIGMTASEVENSTWGKPKDINRTTTAYGVSEQWVYSNYRYIYLDDGVVTAIQD